MTLVAEGKAAEIKALIEGATKSLGYELVRIQLARGKNAKLQIMAERHDRIGMTVDDCAILSKTVEAVLDVEEPISEPYALEVSSPGIDRPLTRVEDFDRFAGFDAKLEVQLPIDGRRRFKGRLLGLDGSSIRFAFDDEELEIPFSDVAKAKLILTDELIEASTRADAPGEDLGEDPVSADVGPQTSAAGKGV